jgi:ribonuclease HI
MGTDEEWPVLGEECVLVGYGRTPTALYGRHEQGTGWPSRHLDGIMGVPCPQKVRIFAWKLATNGLATWDNKYKRNLEISYVCILCGVEREDNFHAFCRCPLAITLWRAMDVWQLPDPASVINTGEDWLLHLLVGRPELERTRILLLLWRIWHVRNEVVHNKKAPPVEASRRFLCSYIDTIMTIKYRPQADHIKGKAPVSDCMVRPIHVDVRVAEANEKRSWSRPEEGWVKLNVDGSFHQESGEAGIGMILRDSSGDIIFSSCRQLFTCSSPLEAELAACMEGCALTLQWNNLPCIIEVDSLEAVSMLKAGGDDRSANAFLLRETKRLMSEMAGFRVEHIRREQNLVSDALANMGRTEARTAVWLRSGPLDIPKLCLDDCNGGV